MRTLLRLLRFLISTRWRVVLAVLLGCLTVASNVGLLGMAAYLIAAAALKPLLVMLTLPIYLVRFMGVSRAAARYAERLVAHDLTFRLLAHLRVWFYSRLVPLAPARLLTVRSGDVLARSVRDVEDLQNVYLGIVAPFLVAALVAALTFGLLRIFSAALAWSALAFLIGAGSGVPLLAALLARGAGPRHVALRADLHAQLVDGVQGMADLLACGRAAERRGAIAALDHALGRVQGRMALVSATQQALNDLLMNLALWTTLILAIPLVAAKAIDGIYLAFLALVVLGSFEAVQPLGQAFQSLGRSLAAGSRLFELIDAPPQVEEPAMPAPLPGPQRCGLEFEHVRFAYHPGDAPALDGVTFGVSAGQRVAVVGASGAGKSTLVRLALRFWDASAGMVRLDGRDVRAYALEDLRAAVGLVAQDTAIFNDTVRGNLRLARPDAGDAELMRALEQAQLAACVRDMPDGLDTWVGEQGLRLSGGERQRLAIARALLKDAPLLILDEPTANLDTVTERALLDALEVLMQGRTTLVITHRLVAMERMDEIVVLDRGRVVERGTHAELRAARGLYRQMLDVQDGLLAIDAERPYRC